MRGIQTVTVLFERHPRCVERLRREAEVARGQRDLGLDTPSACYGFFRTEGPCSAPQQLLCSHVFAELRHRDASKCDRLARRLASMLREDHPLRAHVLQQ
jgi:hypothetical protein